MAFRMYGVMHHLRSRASSVTRLLVLALCLQLAVPLLDLGGIAAQAGEAAFRADLQSSLCHDGKSEAAPGQAPASPSQVKHCIFCLPMAGTPAAAGTAPLTPLPGRAEETRLAVADDQTPASARPVFARSRAPPATPRIA